MIIRTRGVYKRLVESKRRKKESSATNVLDAITEYFDYCWEVRERSLKSCIGYAALIVGAVNYVISIAFIAMFVEYGEVAEGHELDKVECEIVGSTAIYTYCAIF